jgi:hypothetical protein
MASRKEQKEKLRQERQQREQAAAAAAARRRRLGYVVAGALVVAVVVAVVAIAFASGGSDSGSGSSASSSSSWPSGSIPAQKIKDLDAAVAAAGCTFRSPKDEGRGHTLKPQNYKSQPPTSGAHNPVPAHDAAYLKSPGNEHLVHALEHGRVIYWFKASTPPAVKGALKKLYDEDKDLVVLTPDTAPFPYAVAATAWGKLLGCPEYNDKVPDAFRAFRDAYRLKGPEYFPNAE